MTQTSTQPTVRRLAVPGATDALSARLIASHGFECVYIGSYATAASRYGLTDTGQLSLAQLVEQARRHAARAVRQMLRGRVSADRYDLSNHGLAVDVWRLLAPFPSFRLRLLADRCVRNAVPLGDLADAHHARAVVALDAIPIDGRFRRHVRLSSQSVRGCKPPFGQKICA